MFNFETHLVVTFYFETYLHNIRGKQMRPLNILVITPYSEMLPLLRDIASDFPDANFTLQTGDLDQAVLTAANSYHADFDVIVSRGGTAEELADEVTLPIVEIHLSAEDVLRNLIEANPNQGPTAIIGFKSVLKNFEGIGDCLNYRLDLYEADFDDEIDDYLKEVDRLNYSAILCDTVTNTKAQKMGIDSHLLTSGRASIERAFETAMKVCSLDDRLRNENHLLWELIRGQGLHLAVYDDKGSLIYSDLSADMKGVSDFISQNRTGTDTRRLVIRRDGTPYSITPQIIEADQSYKAFIVRTAKGRAKNEYLGLAITNEQEVRHDYESSIFSIIDAGTNLMPIIRKLSSTNAPVMIESEIGSGKEQIARLLYLEGRHHNAPFIQINFRLLNDRGWEFLIESNHSPLYDSEQTLFFENIDALSPNNWKILLSTVMKTRLTERCWLIFSASHTAGDKESELITHFVDELHCVPLSTEPLRRKKTLSEAPTKYLTHLARISGESTPKLTEEAKRLLTSYSWPRNLIQLKEVLNRLYAMQDNGLITEELVRKVLRNEKARRLSSNTSSFADSQFDFMRPLADIEHNIAEMVVSACDGNKTKASSVLGISRTTIWRLLKTSTKE